MEKASRDIRQRYLAVSGGWLGKLVITVSNALGIFDAIVLFIVGVIWYQVVRSSPRELAIILGVYIDGAIPMQYYLNEQSYAMHKDHLDDYWPLFFMGTMAEAGAYLLLDPNGFTFIVCLKSLMFASIWMGRKENGVFLSTALRKGKEARASSIPRGGVDFADNPSSSQQQGSRTSTTSHPRSSTSSRTPSSTATSTSRTSGTSTTSTTPSTRPPDMPADPRYPDAEIKLRELFPDEWARWGMMNSLKNDPKDLTWKLEVWLKERDKAKDRALNYAKDARKQVAALPRDQRAPSTKPLPAVLPPPDPANKIGMNLARADLWLKSLYPDPIVRMGMLETYRSSTNEDAAERDLAHWATQASEVPSRTEHFRRTGLLAQQWRRELRDPRVPVFVDDESMGYNEQIKHLYKDAWTRYGILTRLLEFGKKDRQTKADGIAATSTPEALAERLKSAGRTAEQVQDLFNDDGWKMRDHGWVKGDAESKSAWKANFKEKGDKGGKALSSDKLALLKADMKKRGMRYSEMAKVLDVFSRPRCESQEKAALARLRAYRCSLDLQESEKAAQAARYAPSIDPGVRRFLSEQLAAGQTGTSIPKPRAIELLNASSHTKEDMVKVGQIFSDLGYDVSGKASTTLVIEPADLLDTRLRLMKLYDQDTSLVDVMMAHVMRASSREMATQRANEMIQAANDGKHAAIRNLHQPNADRLEGMKLELDKWFSPGVVGVMKADMLAKDPSQWNAEYAQLVQIGQGQDGTEAERTRYEASVAECRSRGVDDEYYEGWRKPDPKKKGLLSGMYSKIGAGVKQVFK